MSSRFGICWDSINASAGKKSWCDQPHMTIPEVIMLKEAADVQVTQQTSLLLPEFIVCPL